MISPAAPMHIRVAAVLAPYIGDEHATERARNVEQALMDGDLSRAPDVVRECIVDHWSLAGLDVPESAVDEVVAAIGGAS